MKKLFHYPEKGSIGVWVILALVIVGSIYFVDGIFPGADPIDTGEEDKVVIIDNEASSASGAAENALRLRTIEFKECTERVAVDLLVDNSGSMDSGNKLQGLKDALTAFTNNLSDESIVAFHAFNVTPQEKVSFASYGNNKAQIKNAIETMNPDGGTSTRDAFSFVNDRLTAAQQQFPNQEFALIFFSDGIPEAEPRDCETIRCTPTSELRCFQQNQDPTNNPNIAQAIKDKNIKIYSIALLDTQDQCFNDELEGLMNSVASTPENYYNTFNPDDLKSIYSQITFSLCGKVE